MTDLLAAAARQLRVAVRSLARVPAYAGAIVASLAISVAAITTVFSLANAVLLEELPFRDSTRLVWLGSVRPNRHDGPFSLPETMDYSGRARTVEVAAYAGFNAAMATEGVARRLQGMRASANAFDVLGVQPAAGRLLRPADDASDAPRVVVLGHAFWQETFGGDRNAVGQSIRLNDQPHEIVGVLPAQIPLPLPGVQVVVPLQPELDPRRHVRSSTNFLLLFGRMREGATYASVERDLQEIADALRAAFPADQATKLGVAVTPLKEFLVGNTRRTFVVMFGAAALLLLIALANVLNLILVRGIAKRGEVAVRRALGGSGRQLAQGALAEAVLLALAGVAIGALVARLAVSAAAASGIPVLRLEEARLDDRALLFVVLLVVVSVLLFAGVQLLTAMRATPRQALASIGRGAQGSAGETRLRSVFLVTQLGFAMLLTVLTATMARSLARLNAVELGFRPDSVFVARVALPPRKYPDVPAVDRFARALEAELTGTPGIQGAGAISIAPYSAGLAIIPFNVVGRQPEHERERLEAHLRGVTPGYFGAVGARVRQGRGFTAADDAAGAPVAIVSRALATRYLADGDPVGRQLLLNDNDRGPRPMTIVGVVNDMRHVRLDAPPEMDIYVPMAQYSADNAGFIATRHYWVARVGPASAGYERTFARALERIDRDAAMAAVEPMRRLVDRSLAPRTYSVYALSWFALVALVLTAVGVYGVVAYSVAQRRREIGLRLALGATARDIASRFITSAVRLGVVGLGIGVAGALATRGLVSALLFGVSPMDPVIIAAVGAVLLAVTGIAAALPARRAASVDPAITLRDG